jgi:photosystem II stability/assembly factor-like uncharacterized protein
LSRGKTKRRESTSKVGASTNLRPELPLQLTRDSGQQRRVSPTNRTISVPPALIVVLGIVLLLGFGLTFFSNGAGNTSSPSEQQVTPISTVQGQDYHSLAVSPTDPARLWFGSHSGIQESTDGGKTWQPLPGVEGDAMSLARPAADPNVVYMAGHDIFKRSLDGGKTWQDVRTDLPGTDLHGFAANPANAQHLFALVVGHGLYESLDGGARWQPLPAQAPGASGALAVAGGSPPTLYVMSSLGLMRSTDGGKSWHRKDTGLPGGRANALLAVSNQARQWYAATSDGLYYSSDEGTTWRRVALGSQELVALSASQSEPLRVYALSAQGAVFSLEGAMLGRSE